MSENHPSMVARLRGRIRWRPWALRAIMAAFLGLAIAVVWVSNIWLTDRFTESTRNRAELRLAIYSGSILSEIQRHQVVPLLLSRDPVLIRALESNDYTNTSQYLISYVEDIGAASILLLDREGRVVAASDRARLGERRDSDPFFVEATRSNATVFTSNEPETGRFDFTFSRRIEGSNGLAGVILVEINLARVIERWRGTSEAVFLTNSQGEIILSTEPRWRGRTEAEALAQRTPPTAIQRALAATGDWVGDGTNGFFGASTIRLESRIAFRGWRIVSYTAYASVRERVNGVLALEIMGFALLLAGAFYVLSRRARLQSAVLARESAELRRLNSRLQREIAERQRAERNLEEAEQSLAQSQKLAALGEMSAAVSHELNQPLAAMKTYLAGARLLLQRRRTEEAAASFQRIDDLIERMSAITRQLKSYARKGADALEPVDLRDALKGALSIMEAQLRSDRVEISRDLPDGPAMVFADRLRLEQVIINLLRNGLDAMQGSDRRVLELMIVTGEEVVLTVRDNGSGIADLDALFEPFYTTKRPGDGVGLGLADRLRLEQVIINLLRNGLDAMQGSDRRVLELMIVTGEEVVLTVRDNGSGIADLDALFEPFYTTKRPGDGVGLGLAISSTIVGDLGGRLTARNSQRGGAVFEMRLPSHRGGTVADASQGPEAAE